MHCRAILSSPVYAIDAKNDLNKYLSEHGFRNVHKVEMIPRTQLDGLCESSKLEERSKEASARLFNLDSEVKAARAVRCHPNGKFLYESELCIAEICTTVSRKLA